MGMHLFSYSTNSASYESNWILILSIAQRIYPWLNNTQYLAMGILTIELFINIVGKRIICTY